MGDRSSIAPRARRASSSLIWFGVAAAAIHASALAVLDAIEPAARDAAAWTPGHAAAWTAGGAPRPGAGAARAGAARALPTCEADVGLAGAARLVYCASPLAGRACLGDLALAVRAGLVGCRAPAPAEIALIDAAAVDEIEAEPLMPELDPARQEAFEQQQAEAVEQLEEQAEKRALAVPRDAQVVEITRPDVEQAPERTRFVSEYDSAVDRQTVARGSTEDMVARPGPPAREPVQDPREAQAPDAPEAHEAPDPPGAPEAPGEPDREAPRGPGALAMREPGVSEPGLEREAARTPGAADGVDAPAGSGVLAARGDSDRHAQERDVRRAGDAASERARKRASEQSDSAGGGGWAPLLRPTDDVLERVVGGGSVDHLEDVAAGEVTSLSSVRWKYASFFNRMKRQVARQWNPAGVYTKHDPTGHVYGVRDRITHVRVSLSPSGALAAIHVLKGSGVDILDDEAVRAFRAAQPFPNPPQAMVDAGTRLITFSFRFHFEVGDRRSSWRIFWQD